LKGLRFGQIRIEEDGNINTSEEFVKKIMNKLSNRDLRDMELTDENSLKYTIDLYSSIISILGQDLNYLLKNIKVINSAYFKGINTNTSKLFHILTKVGTILLFTDADITFVDELNKFLIKYKNLFKDIMKIRKHFYPEFKVTLSPITIFVNTTDYQKVYNYYSKTIPELLQVGFLEIYKYDDNGHIII